MQVAVRSPCLDLAPRIVDRQELLGIQVLGAQFAVKGLDVAVLVGLSGSGEVARKPAGQSPAPAACRRRASLHKDFCIVSLCPTSDAPWVNRPMSFCHRWMPLTRFARKSFDPMAQLPTRALVGASNTILADRWIVESGSSAARYRERRGKRLTSSIRVHGRRAPCLADLARCCCSAMLRSNAMVDVDRLALFVVSGRRP